jgi:hypothetical protein
MDELLKAIENFINAFDQTVSEYGSQPAGGSQMESEMNSYHDTKRIQEVFSFAQINLRVGRDQLASMPSLIRDDNIMTNPVAARAVLEASALAGWILDPTIDAKERVKRGIAQLCDGKVQLRSFYQDDKDSDEAERAAHIARINDFLDNRLPPILAANGITYESANGKPIPAHKYKPNMVDMTEHFLGHEFRTAYRVLSGVAHGQPQMIITFYYDIENAQGGDGMKKVEFKPGTGITLYSFKMAVQAYQKALAAFFSIAGWDFNKIKPAYNNFEHFLREEIKKK